MTRVSNLDGHIPIKTWVALWSCFGVTVGSAVGLSAVLSCALSAIEMSA